MTSTDGYLLEVTDLKTYFPVKKGLFRHTAGYVKAVNGVSFRIKSGLALGLVGESGCGKTTIAKTIVRLVPATDGEVNFDGIDVLSAGRKELHRLRRSISLIFQDPLESLNPRMTVGSIIGEPLKVHLKFNGEELVKRIKRLLWKVGLSPDSINRYPHELSGGQRQRIGIARALALEPKLVICDEPVSSLDISIQSQILNLLKDLQDEFGLTFLFISHDLAVVEFFCDFVAVIYLGRIVEYASAHELYRNPLHPYTRVLISAIPKVNPCLRGQRRRFVGEVRSVSEQPSGCSYHPRCPLANGECRKVIPRLDEKGGGKGHLVACWKC